jgi:hypothetical protein
MRETWVVFKHDGEELLAVTVRYSTWSNVERTRARLAKRCGCRAVDIKVHGEVR